jgi:hypothetical protein
MTPGAVTKLKTALNSLRGEGSAMASSKIPDSRVSSIVQLEDTTGFQVWGETEGILRALEMTVFRKGRISSKSGTVVKIGGTSLTGGGAAMKVATGSGVAVGGRGVGRGVLGSRECAGEV